MQHANESIQKFFLMFFCSAKVERLLAHEPFQVCVCQMKE